MAKYAIILTGSFGDILNGTYIAAHLKKEGHEVDWYVSSQYQGALKGFPHIDNLIVIPAKGKDKALVPATKQAIEMAKGKYHKITVPGPYMRRWWPMQKYDILECIRLAAEEDLGITEWLVPRRSILVLDEEEKKRARDFAAKLKKPICLFEWDAQSGQSHLTPAWIDRICAEFKGWTVVLSGRPIKFKIPNNAVDGSGLSVRDTVELYRHCKFMIGVSSGITCACESTYNEDFIIPRVEACNSRLWSSECYPHKTNAHVVYKNSLDEFIKKIREVRALRSV